MGLIRQNCNVTDGINIRAEAKEITRYFSECKFSYYHLGQSGIETLSISQIFKLAGV